MTRPSTSRSSRHLPSRILLTATILVIVGVSSSCSDGDGQSSSTTRPSAPADQVVADAIGRYDRELLRPPAEVADEFVFFTYQTRWSLSAPSARCATDKLIESVGGRARLGDVSLGELTGRRNDTAERNAALACATPEEITRMPSRELAPDVDVTRLRALQVALLAGAARERGLTADEASCLATRTWGSLSDEDVLMLTRGGSSAQDLAKRLSGIEQLRSCVTTARMKELADRLAPEVQRELQASSTTVSGPTRG